MATELQPSSITSSWLVSIHGANDKWHISSGSIELIIYQAFNVTRKKKNSFPFSRQHVRCLQNRFMLILVPPLCLSTFWLNETPTSIRKTRSRGQSKRNVHKISDDEISPAPFSEKSKPNKIALSDRGTLNGARLFCVMFTKKKSDFDNILHVRHSTRFLNESFNKKTLCNGFQSLAEAMCVESDQVA